MWFDLKDKEQAKEASKLLDSYSKRGEYVKIVARSPQRTLPQNAYMHVLFSIFSLETGYSNEYTKQYIFKRFVCHDVFLDVEIVDGKEVVQVRSTNDLSKAECHLCLERFRNFAALELGIYLPQPHERSELAKAENYINKNRDWLNMG